MAMQWTEGKDFNKRTLGGTFSQKLAKSQQASLIVKTKKFPKKNPKNHRRMLRNCNKWKQEATKQPEILVIDDWGKRWKQEREGGEEDGESIGPK